MWGYLTRRLPGVDGRDQSRARPARGLRGALLPGRGAARPRRFRAPTDKERAALQDLYDQLAGKDGLDGKDLQDIVYAVGNGHKFEPLRDWFGAIYGVLLGAEQGPRFGLVHRASTASKKPASSSPMRWPGNCSKAS